MKILAIYQNSITYRPDLQNDIKALRETYEVRELPLCGLLDIKALWQQAKWCDVVFSYFGKLHAFYAAWFCELLGEKLVVHAGGDDVAKVPEIGYGMFSH